MTKDRSPSLKQKFFRKVTELKNISIAAVTSIVLFVLIGNVFSQESNLIEIRAPSNDTKSNSLKKQDNDGVRKTNFLINFSDYLEGSIDDWLKSKGFRFYRGAKNRTLIELSVHDGALVVKAKKPVRGYIFNESVNLKEFSKVRIEWGIIQYPKNAFYERNIRNEALIVYIFFGYKKVSSGSFVLPSCRYFIGLFLSKDDEINEPYIGKYYHEGGRFVCLGNPEPNKTVISEFDLVRAFQTYFEKEVPVVSGISLGVDTSSSGDGGKAAAFIKRIEFIK